jgi:SWI/SNF-related matrix-associated actin-dependent regulator of chromatin subfamily A member 5
MSDENSSSSESLYSISDVDSDFEQRIQKKNEVASRITRPAEVIRTTPNRPKQFDRIYLSDDDDDDDDDDEIDLSDDDDSIDIGEDEAAPDPTRKKGTFLTADGPISTHKESDIHDGSYEQMSRERGETRKGSKKRVQVLNLHITGAECALARKESTKSLALYRHTLQPFVSPKVAKMLEDVHTGSVPEVKVGRPPKNGNAQDKADANGLQSNNEAGMITQPPTLVSNCIMKSYQLEGLSWLVDRYDKSVSCILADEMGLGKTLQSISFFAHLRHVRKLRGPNLVIVPLSVLSNWTHELKKWCPSLVCVRLHAHDKLEQQRQCALAADPDIDVVVTTYDVLKSKMHFTLRKIVWRSVFLDEGHRMKNDQSKAAQAVQELTKRFTVILTGTPVQNNLHESWAMLNILAPQIFTDSSAFDNAFYLERKRIESVESVESVQSTGMEVDGNPSGGAQPASRAHRSINKRKLAEVHYLLRLFVLRRLKSEVEQKLPIKLETRINCPMTRLQKDIIMKLLVKDKSMLMKALDKDRSVSGGDGECKANGSRVYDDKSVRDDQAGDGAAAIDEHAITHMTSLKSLLVQLRKAANHPYLFPGVEPPTVHGYATEMIIKTSGKMVVLDKLLERLNQKGHRVVLFSQYTRTLDIICDYLDLRQYRWTRLDGKTSRIRRELYVKLFNKEGSNQFIFVLSTRAGGEGINLASADTVILFDSDWNPQVCIYFPSHVYGNIYNLHVHERCAFI